ncbi:ABC transporter permease subunit [Haladaptatus cibarius]|uniref:ABC transporter permease subunit n=1 Tax=Haladaptatus cibarius TaxID=453847 RepID=UPI0006785691|nr:ABC transporter permease subunit [Haladaptatus cibarius]
MSWLSVAKKDFIDSRRSKGLLGLISLYVLLLALIVYFAGDSPQSAMTDVLALMSLIGIFIIPLSALIVAYLSIAGERESGSIKYLLGLPNTRFDLVVGKFVGRSMVITVGLLLAFGVAGVLGVVMLDSVDFVVFAKFFLLMLFFTLTYIGIAVGLSALCASRSRAMASSVGVFFVFNVLWTVPTISPAAALRYVADDKLGMTLGPEIYELVFLISPPYAFQRAAGLVFTEQSIYFPRYITPQMNIPFYLEEWFMLVILGAWLVAPLAIGYLAFERADLG